tara:strand:- start:63 stop:704 length:642 start_codon:yes stop_codon:yes gene_type:complete
MTGKFLISRKKGSKLLKTSFYYDSNIFKKHNHIYFILNNGLTLIYNDVRKFGFFILYKNTNLKDISFIKKLGPEPLSVLFNKKYFKNYIKNKKKNVKNLLMDQTFVCGLGNIYVNETLYLSKIHPLRLCGKLDEKDIYKLTLYIKMTLRKSIYRGGSSIKDFKNISGQKGNFQESFNVYGRENKKCIRFRCKGTVKNIIISNRSSFYCDKCQS